MKKTNVMASSPITSWQIEKEKVEAVTDFIFWAPKSLKMVTAAMKAISNPVQFSSVQSVMSDSL